MAISNVVWHDAKDPHPTGLNNLRRVALFLAEQKAYSRDSSLTIPYIGKHLGIADSQLRQMLIKSPKPGFVIYEPTENSVRLYLLSGWENYPATLQGRRGQILPQYDKVWEDATETDKVFTPEGVIASRETAQSNTALVLEHAKTLQRLQEFESLPVAKVKSGATGKIIVETANLEITPEVVSFLAEQFEKMVKGDKEAALQCLLISATIYTSKE